MLHVITVHWRIDTWIEPQLRYIRRYLPADTRIYASLNGIDPSQRAFFTYAEDLPGTHPEKLNSLAKIASHDAQPGDHLMFIDGDAFPIAPITPDQLLADTPLAAVRRDENFGDPQPHPCFCLTTVGFWNEIGGDWRAGHTWVNSVGYRTSDVGANLLAKLDERGVKWRPMLRSNPVDLHPLWFAIYGGVVYHQGAGFRTRLARSTLDLRAARVPPWMPVLRRIDKNLAMRGAMQRRKDAIPLTQADVQLAEDILADIQADRDFLAPLMGTATNTD